MPVPPLLTMKKETKGLEQVVLVHYNQQIVDVVLASLLLTLNRSQTMLWISIVDFEQVNPHWVEAMIFNHLSSLNHCQCMIEKNIPHKISLKVHFNTFHATGLFLYPWKHHNNSGFLILTGEYPGVPCSKPLDCSNVDSAFHPSKVDKMSIRNFWELSGKK